MSIEFLGNWAKLWQCQRSRVAPPPRHLRVWVKKTHRQALATFGAQQGQLPQLFPMIENWYIALVLVVVSVVVVVVCSICRISLDESSAVPFSAEKEFSSRSRIARGFATLRLHPWHLVTWLCLEWFPQEGTSLAIRLVAVRKFHASRLSALSFSWQLRSCKPKAVNRLHNCSFAAISEASLLGVRWGACSRGKPPR